MVIINVPVGVLVYTQDFIELVGSRLHACISHIWDSKLVLAILGFTYALCSVYTLSQADCEEK